LTDINLASLFGLEPLSNNGWWKFRKVAPESQEWYLALLANFGISGTVGLVLGFVLCLIILKLGQKTISPPFNKIPFFGKRLSAKPPKMLVPRGTQAALKSIKGTAPGIITRINPLNWRIFNLQKIAEEEDDEKYQAGEPYGDPSVMATGIVKDLKSVGLKAGMKDLQTLLKVVQVKGKPVNDREMTVSADFESFFFSKRSWY
jgi:hypothetical protein